MLVVDIMMFNERSFILISALNSTSIAPTPCEYLSFKINLVSAVLHRLIFVISSKIGETEIHV